MTLHSQRSILTAGLLLLASPAAIHADEAIQTIRFSDPSRPGTLKISAGRAELRVIGADTKEVTVKSDAPVQDRSRKDGMRVLSSSSSFTMTEQDNVIILEAGADAGGRIKSEFEVTVPRSTSIVIPNSWGGDITCTGIDGDIEINSMHGEIELQDVAGGIVVGTMNGEIEASIRALNDGKPLSFTSMNGEVLVRVPPSAKANVRLRTQNGTVLTDFDETALITRAESVGPMPRAKFGSGGKVLTTEVQDAIREATQLSATAIKEALEAIKEGLEAARLSNDDARAQMEEARRQMERARRDLEREKREMERRAATDEPRISQPAAPAAPAIPAKPQAPGPIVRPPKPFPTITGGKLVTGTLNGGGPEISIATMNGDVILRKLETK